MLTEFVVKKKNCVFVADRLSSDDTVAHVESQQAQGCTSIPSLKGSVSVNPADLDQMRTTS